MRKEKEFLTKPKNVTLLHWPALATTCTRLLLIELCFQIFKWKELYLASNTFCMSILFPGNSVNWIQFENIENRMILNRLTSFKRNRRKVCNSQVRVNQIDFKIHGYFVSFRLNIAVFAIHTLADVNGSEKCNNWMSN